MSWKPNYEEGKYLDLLMSMCEESRNGVGTDSRETFITNTKMMCDLMEKLKPADKPPEPPPNESFTIGPY